MLYGAAALAGLTLPVGGSVELDAQREILLDPDGTLTVEQVVSRSHEFAPPGQIKKLGYLKGAAWLRFTLTSPQGSASLWWLELQSPLVDHATLYIPTREGSYHTALAGDHERLDARELPYRNPLFRLELPADEATTVLVRVQGRNTMNFRTVLWTPEQFLESLQREKLFFGLFISILLLTMLYSFWLLRATRDHSYSLLIAYVLLMLVSTLCLQGYGYQYVWRDSPWLNETLLIVSWMLLPPALVAFNLSFVGALRAPRSRSINGLLAWTTAFAFVSVLLALTTGTPWVRLANSIWNPVVTLAMATLMANMAYRGNRNARVLFVAMAILTGCVAARTLRNLGLIDADAFSDNAYYVGMMVHLLLVQYVTSLHYRTLRDEKEQAQAEVLRLTQASRQELNEQVQQRTTELSATLRQLESALHNERLSQKRQQLFVDTLSHELKTPLTIIDLSAQNLAMNHHLSDDEKMARYQKILDATSRILKVMEHHFDLANLSREQSDAVLRPCSPKELLSQVAAASEIFADQHTVRIEGDDLPETFTCDPETLNLALRCLMDNALKYSPPGSTVTLRGYRRGNRKEDGICLEVVDEGPGISSEDLQQLFTPYFRSDVTRHIPGTGLGLANAKRLVAAKGGELTVESTPGKGSCFRITLRP